MLTLPFLALRLLFRRPQLFFLASFPGILTVGVSFALSRMVWLSGISLAIPLAIATFFISWLAVGNLALLPVEDFIIDQVQLSLWQQIRLPARSLSTKRVIGEAVYGLLLAFIGLIIFITEFIPGAVLVDFVLTALLLSYNFLSTLYARRHLSKRERGMSFVKDLLANFLLGLILTALLFIPLLNVFLLGYAQVLATLFYFREEIANTTHT